MKAGGLIAIHNSITTKIFVKNVKEKEAFVDDPAHKSIWEEHPSTERSK
jgi:hypothetical protein